MARQWARVSLKDAYGRVTRISREIGDELTLGEYLTDVANLCTYLQAISDLGIVSGDFAVTAEVTATAPAAGANVDVGATFVGWGTGENSGRKVVTKVPGFDTAKVDAQGNIDLTDVDVAAYLGLFESGGAFLLSDGEKVSSWISGTLDK